MSIESGSWVVVLNGVALSGGDGAVFAYGYGEGPFGAGPFGGVNGLNPDIVRGYLTSPPDGLGVPSLRVEDQVFPQRDGVAHYSDWYDARTITLANVSLNSDTCPSCPATRVMAKDLMEAWSRHCEDTELVIFTDCHGTDDDLSLVGPFGIRGRPRVAELTWVGQGSKTAVATLRFDSVDHRMYILDKHGSAGTGGLITPLVAQPISYPDPLALYRLDEPAGSTSLWGGDVPYSGAGIRGFTPLLPNMGTSSLFDSQVVTTDFFAPYLVHTETTYSFWWMKSDAVNGNIVVGTGGVSSDYRLTTSYLQKSGINYDYEPGTSSILTDGDPHMITVTSKEGDNIRLYIDGELNTVFDQIQVWPGEAVEQIISPAFGFFSNLAYWDTQLSDEEIESLYRSTRPESTETDQPGNVCVPMKITFSGSPGGLTNPRVVFEDGSYVGLDMTLNSTDSVVIDTETGSAVLTTRGVSASVLSSVVGDPFSVMYPGVNNIYLSSSSLDDQGTAEVYRRAAVISA